MTEMMKSGECYSKANPLVVAVDSSLLRQELLAKDTEKFEDPPKVKFKGPAPVKLELLAGMHRVKAARIASGALRSQLEKVERRSGRVQKNLRRGGSMDGREATDDGEASDEEVATDELPTGDSQLGDDLEQATEDLAEWIKRTIESVETWPVRFYDIGLLQHLCRCNKLTTITTEQLKSKSNELPKSLRQRGAEDVLLSFLAGNERSPIVPKTTEETFLEILIRNLHSKAGGGGGSWAHLISTSRTLHTICHRPHVWELASKAISVSRRLHNSWVVSAGLLRDVSSSPSSKVRVPLKLASRANVHSADCDLHHPNNDQEAAAPLHTDPPAF